MGVFSDDSERKDSRKSLAVVNRSQHSLSFYRATKGAKDSQMQYIETSEKKHLRAADPWRAVVLVKWGVSFG